MPKITYRYFFVISIYLPLNPSHSHNISLYFTHITLFISLPLPHTISFFFFSLIRYFFLYLTHALYLSNSYKLPFSISYMHYLLFILSIVHTISLPIYFPRSLSLCLSKFFFSKFLNFSANFSLSF